MVLHRPSPKERREDDKSGKTGIKKASTDEEVLKHWAEEEGDEWAQLLMTHRGISKIHGTYVTGLQEWIDGRFRIHDAEPARNRFKGRLSSKDPNLRIFLEPVKMRSQFERRSLPVSRNV